MPHLAVVDGLYGDGVVRHLVHRIAFGLHSDCKAPIRIPMRTGTGKAQARKAPWGIPRQGATTVLDGRIDESCMHA